MTTNLTQNWIKINKNCIGIEWHHSNFALIVDNANIQQLNYLSNN